MTEYQYEIHVTVAAETDATAAKFVSACRHNNIKPIVLDLTYRTTKLVDMMTSSRYTGTDGGAMVESNRVANVMESSGLRVVRQKIETVPWHPAAPQSQRDVTPTSNYFEVHIPVTFLSVHEVSVKHQLATIPNLHVSRNILKACEDTFTIMATIRLNTSRDVFNLIVAETYDALRNLPHVQLAQRAPHVEYALYDSNIHHDSTWITQGMSVLQQATPN